MPRWILLLLPLLLPACQSQRQQKMLRQSAAAHDEALMYRETLMSELAQLTQRKNSINIQGRALTEAEIRFVTEVENLEDAWYQLEEHAKAPEDQSQAATLKWHTSYRDSVRALSQRVHLLSQSP
ncbi:MAG: hypothetical protein IPN33_17670 [Saprospiraceae bacterium]|nr:hypothetical protein [Saprospiraceae bacterium]